MLDSLLGDLEQYVHQFTLVDSTGYIDKWNDYEHIIPSRATISRTQYEWTRDSDGDGKLEVHINASDGMWIEVVLS